MKNIDPTANRGPVDYEAQPRELTLEQLANADYSDLEPGTIIQVNGQVGQAEHAVVQLAAILARASGLSINPPIPGLKYVDACLRPDGCHSTIEAVEMVVAEPDRRTITRRVKPVAGSRAITVHVRAQIHPTGKQPVLAQARISFGIGWLDPEEHTPSDPCDFLCEVNQNDAKENQRLWDSVFGRSARTAGRLAARGALHPVGGFGSARQLGKPGRIRY